MRHTPGPWKYGIRRDGSIWLSLGDPAVGPHFQGDLIASPIDARLIAAAPELLAIAKAQIDYCPLCSTGSFCRTPFHDQLLAVIALAQGADTQSQHEEASA